jgi:LPXTG-motif cell wall-anchored protein
MAAVPDSGLGASSGSWWLKNSTAFGSMNADATYEYKKTVVKSDSTSWDAADMSESDAGTLAVGKTTSWRIRILLKNDLLENSVTLTDKLPKGLKLSAIAISSDAYSNYTELSLGEADSTGKRSISGTYALSDGKSISASGSSQYDNTNFDTVTVTFSGDLSELKDMPLYVKVTCEVTDAFYADLGEDETMVAATNTATVTFGSDKTYWSNTQTKKITMPKASTVAKTYYSDRADGEGKLLYAVSINPEGADLDDGDTLELDDVLKYDPNIKKDSKTGTYTLTLITDSVKLYESDGNGAFEVNADGTVTNGTPVNIDAWSYVPGGSDTSKEETRTLHLEVPDGKVLMLVYMYQITTDLKDISFSTNITNTATLTGKKQYTSTENNAKAWKYSSVQANGGSDKSYTFKKVEKDKWNKKLGGAVFTLYKYKPDTDEFVSTGLTYTTISGDQTKNVNVGTFSINYKNDQAAYGYTYDTAYYLMETTSPDGYDLPEEKDRTKYYFYFSKPVSDTTVEGASEEESGTECMPTDFKTDTEKYHAVDLTTTSASAVVENTPALTIRKVWTNTNGDSLEVDPDIVVKVVVHRLENGEDKGNCWEVLLTSGNNWTYTDKTLSTVSADGVVYTYEAEEVSVYKDGDGTELKGNYDVSYDNNGISVGGITITNQLIAQYELPQTGGSGRTLWYMFGGILVLGAGFLLIYRKHKII